MHLARSNVAPPQWCIPLPQLSFVRSPTVLNYVKCEFIVHPNITDFEVSPFHKKTSPSSTHIIMSANARAKFCSKTSISTLSRHLKVSFEFEVFFNTFEA
jgi:hypothetical protein